MNVRYKEQLRSFIEFGDVSLPLSTEALGHAVGCDAALDASRQGCGVRKGLMPVDICEVFSYAVFLHNPKDSIPKHFNFQ